MLTTKHSKTVVSAIVRNKPVSISKKIYFMNPEEMSKIKKPEKKRRKMYSEEDSDDDGFTVGRPQPKYFKEITAKPGFHCEPIYRGEERFAIFIAGAQAVARATGSRSSSRSTGSSTPNAPSTSSLASQR